MRAAIVPPKLSVPKTKLKLPPPKTSFRVHLDPARAPPPAPAPARPPDPSKRPAPPPRERDEPRELDSAARTTALLAPPPHVVVSPPPTAPIHTTPPSTVEAQQLAIELVEKAAFWGDGNRGVAQLRFNGRARAGLANATITLEHDGEETHLRVEGIDPEVEEQLREQLARRGVKLSSNA